MKKYFKLLIYLFCFSISLIIPAYSGIGDKQLEKYVENLNIDELIGQKIIISPPWLLEPETFKYEYLYSSSILDFIIEELKIGNFIINKKNYDNWIDHLNKEFHLIDLKKKTNAFDFSTELIKKECKIIQERLKKAGKGIPGIIATDYEGGRVQHLPFKNENITIQIPSAMNLGALRSPKKARDIGRFIAKNLYWLGVNVNLAPVLDLNYIGETSLIGTRSFSCNDEVVSILATEFIKGLSDQGVAAVLKHWPGHGPVTFDKKWNKSMDFHLYPKPLHLLHDEISMIESKYLQPYYYIFKSKYVKNYGVMTSHLIANSLGCPRNNNVPVTFCKEAIDDYLRRKFEGVIITDDFVLLSSTHEISIEKAIWKSFKAGNDMVIIGSIYLNDDYRSKQKAAHELLNSSNSFEINFEKIKMIFRYLKDQYSYDSKDITELKKSVLRILRWKLNIQKLRKGIPSENNMWDYSVFQPDSSDKISFSDNELEFIDGIFFDSLVYIQYDPKPIQKKDNKVICPIELPSSDDGQIFCITPTYKSGDLKRAFNSLGVKNVIEYELYYEANSDNFILENISEIKSQINKNNIRLIIFGLVNNYLHIEILNHLKNFIDDTNIMSVVICFHDPSILSSTYIPKNALVFTTFSNKYISNLAAAKFLKGDINIRDIKYLPVRNVNRPIVDVLIDKNKISYDIMLNNIFKTKYIYLMFVALLTLLILFWGHGLAFMYSFYITIIPIVLILFMNAVDLQTIEAIRIFKPFHGFLDLIENKYPYPEIVIDILFALLPLLVTIIVPIMTPFISFIKKNLLEMNNNTTTSKIK